MHVTYDRLPEAVGILLERITQIEKLLLQNRGSESAEDEFYSIQEAAEFLNLTVPTLYNKVQKAELPVSKRGNRLFFSKKDLTEWIKSGKRKTNEELAREAIAHIGNYKKRAK